MSSGHGLRGRLRAGIAAALLATLLLSACQRTTEPSPTARTVKVCLGPPRYTHDCTDTSEAEALARTERLQRTGHECFTYDTRTIWCAPAVSQEAAEMRSFIPKLGG